MSTACAHERLHGKAGSQSSVGLLAATAGAMDGAAGEIRERVQRVKRATDLGWLEDVLERASREFGSRMKLEEDGSSTLRWC